MDDWGFITNNGVIVLTQKILCLSLKQEQVAFKNWKNYHATYLLGF